jgi:hypothetical protein
MIEVRRAWKLEYLLRDETPLLNPRDEMDSESY